MLQCRCLSITLFPSLNQPLTFSPVCSSRRTFSSVCGSLCWYRLVDASPVHLHRIILVLRSSCVSSVKMLVFLAYHRLSTCAILIHLFFLLLSIFDSLSVRVPYGSENQTTFLYGLVKLLSNTFLQRTDFASKIGMLRRSQVLKKLRNLLIGTFFFFKSHFHKFQ